MRALRILVVDDDRDLADSLAILLELEGHGVAVAYDARQALRGHEGEDFDLVLMDIRLPDRSGLDCLDELRRARPATDVVLMTAYGIAGMVTRARERGALGVVSKPLDVEELSSVLKLLAGGLIPVAGAPPDFAGRLTETLAAKDRVAVVVQDAEQAAMAARDGAADVVILDLTPRPLDPEGLVATLAAALAGDRRRVPIVVLAGQDPKGPSDGGGQPGLSIVECFAGARNEAYLLERIEKVRDHYALCDREPS